MLCLTVIVKVVCAVVEAPYETILPSKKLHSTYVKYALQGNPGGAKLEYHFD